MFSPPFFLTEAETRQKLLRNVKKEVGGVFFLFPCRLSRLVFTGAVAMCVRLCVDIHVHQPRVR